MKRVRQSIIILAIIVALILLTVRVMGLQMSQEKLLSVKEASLHYGPSDEVIYEYTGNSGQGIVIGKCGDDGLSLVNTRRVAGILYGLGDGELGYIDCPNKLNVFYDWENDRVYGIGYDLMDDHEVQVFIRVGTDDDEAAFWVDTDENGFFVKENAAKDAGLKTIDELGDGEFSVGVYAEATDVNGNIITSNYQKGLLPMDLIVPDSGYPVDWSFMLDAPDGDLSVDVLNQFNRVISDNYHSSGERSELSNMMCSFIPQGGGSINECKLKDILRRFPKVKEFDQEMLESLRSSPKWGEFGYAGLDPEDYSLDQALKDFTACDGKALREAVNYYTGMDIGDLDQSETIYLKEYDAYCGLYYQDDYGPFMAEYGYKDGGNVKLWRCDLWGNALYSIKLGEKDGRYIIEGYYDSLSSNGAEFCP